VIGAGVSGLTSAICLAEAGLRVAIQAAEPPQETTSAVAGAVWGVHLVGTDHRVPGWAQDTRAVLVGLAGQPGTGVRVVRGLEAVRVPPDPPPDPPPDATGDATGGAPDGSDFALCPAGELPAGYVAGWRVTEPLVAMPVYLGYLRDRLLAAGGQLLAPRFFATLAEAAQLSGELGRPPPVLVNCPGVGAHRLVPDRSVTPVRGQAVVVTNPGLTEFFIGSGADPADLTYFFPHEQTVVLGGTQDFGDWSRVPDPAAAQRILAACAAIEPRLAGAAVLSHRVGLRPARPRVRLEAEVIAGRRVVHNYGHGGGGITLSWGCARDAARLVLDTAG
jgi:D-amino-acid oxidase